MDEVKALVSEVEEAYRDACKAVAQEFNLDSYVDEAARICADYDLNAISPYNVRKVLQIERERKECNGCAGLPCKKHREYQRGEYPTVYIYGGHIYERRYYCRYQQEEMRRQKEQRESEKAEEKRATALKSARLPKRYMGKTLADYKEDADNKDAVYFAQNSAQYGLGAYLYGECGCGKTMLAAIIAQMWLELDKSVIFIKVPALLDDLRATYNGDGNESDIYAAMHSADLLVLDDLGMEKPSRFAGTTLCKIIDDRYDNDAATIITSNNPLHKVERDLNNAHDGENLNGTRLVDRLKQFCRPIKLKGGSRR